MKQQFIKPPKPTNPSGEERTAGFEFEFTGVEMKEAAEMISILYGGKVKEISTYEYQVSNTSFGTFNLELDAQLLREKKYEKLLKYIGIDLNSYESRETLEESFMELASSVVPFEIITPPIALSSLHELDRLVDTLRDHSARGTGSSIIYAFGLHINPEIPDDSSQSLLNHLRAFVLLDPWIRKDADVDVSRRLTPFINKYEDPYITHILEPGYSPDHQTLIKDYFEFENSRNRPLDMLPVFMYLDEKLTSSLLEDTLTSSRPTYHYRLPNCSLDEPEWSLAKEWNRWILVEKLAADEKSLFQYSKAYLKMQQETIIRFDTKWIELIGKWVNNVW